MKQRISRLIVIALCCVGLGVGITAAEVRIMCYHTFLGNPKIYTDFSVDEFAEHIQVMTSKGYHFVTFKAMRDGNVTGNKNILLVIDDGNISVNNAYLQVLKPQHIPAMLAIYPGIISSRHFAMTWDQLRDMQSHGFEFASHGYFHEFLNQKLKDTRPLDFEKEAKLSKSILEKELHIPIDVYVFPFGICTVEGKELLKDNGYQYAMTIRSGITQIPLSRNLNPLQLPRTMMTRATAKAVLQAL